jgi:hypothetical protein
MIENFLFRGDIWAKHQRHIIWDLKSFPAGTFRCLALSFEKHFLNPILVGGLEQFDFSIYWECHAPN